MERASAQTRTLSSHSWRNETAAVVDLSSLYWNSLPLKNIHGQKRLSGSGDPATSLTNTACSTPCISNAASWTPRTFIIGTYDEHTHVRAHTHTQALIYYWSEHQSVCDLLQRFCTCFPTQCSNNYYFRSSTPLIHNLEIYRTINVVSFSPTVNISAAAINF